MTDELPQDYGYNVTERPGFAVRSHIVVDLQCMITRSRSIAAPRQVACFGHSEPLEIEISAIAVWSLFAKKRPSAAVNDVGAVAFEECNLKPHRLWEHPEGASSAVQQPIVLPFAKACSSAVSGWVSGHGQ